MPYPKINELITAAKCFIRDGALADHFNKLASAAAEELNAIPSDPHRNHVIAGARVELDPGGTIKVEGLTYSVALLAGDLVTPPGQWCQIRREGGTLVVRTAREEFIARKPIAFLREGMEIADDLASVLDANGALTNVSEFPNCLNIPLEEGHAILARLNAFRNGGSA